ncbi:MAG: hypothetical protein C3F11_02320 [Methylocystaceae bacterium]|nr:MAG: hypothetical protein C3F11_02320 [Methylocystaceae bacterium]
MIKRFFESFLFLSRWLLAPFFLMLAAGLLELLFKAGVHLWEATKHLVTASESNVTLLVLDLIDMTLTGALVVTVMLSVYENFVSKVDTENQPGWPDWMGVIDFSELKLKLLSTIVAISAIKLLEAFMDVPHVNDRELYFYLGIHLTFVVSTVAFALAERLASNHANDGEKPH